MIWSFVKVFLFVALVALIALGATHMADMGGGMRLSIGTMEFTLGPVQAVIALLLALLVLWLLLKLLGFLGALIRFLNGDETAVSRYFDRNRERKGYRALSESLMALAAGEGKAALNQAVKAEKYLDQPEITGLLAAQAAEMQGDTRRATEAYKRLLSDDRTRFVAVRGLMRQKLAEGDTETAMKLAERAFSLKPKHEEVQDTLLKLQAESGDWQGARKVLGAKLQQGLLPRDVYRRRDAVLALQEAKVVMDEEASIEAREAAIAANKMSPDLIPAAVMAADGYVRNGKPKYAARVLRKAWGAQPHPDLAAAYAAIEPGESPKARLKRFQSLIAMQPNHEETRLLRAELNIAAEDFPAARRALGDLPETHPTARCLTIMAAIAKGQGEDDTVVRAWLTRALTAGRGPQWVCDKCQHVHGEWRPVCENCGGFDTLSWREAASASVTIPNGADMLPMIVGSAPAAVAAPEEGAAPPLPPRVVPPPAAEPLDEDTAEILEEDALILDEEVGHRDSDTAANGKTVNGKTA